ncbi:MAG: hypothetical protein ACLVL7_00885 [Anaerotruncus massiliensis (ex Togo et al. 2019)]
MGEELSLASHQISANWTALLPISETVCPAAIGSRASSRGASIVP